MIVQVDGRPSVVPTVLTLEVSRGRDAFTLNHVRSLSGAVPCTSGALPTPGGISGRHFWLPRGAKLMPSTAAATESSAELSVGPPGAAKEASSMANSFQLGAHEKAHEGRSLFRGTQTHAYPRIM